MPVIAALSINDGQTTPVAHTFSPTAVTGGKSEFAERTSGIPSGFQTISHEVRKPSSAGAAHRIVIGFNFPVVETINGVATVSRFSTAKVEINLSSLSTEQERKDALAYVKNYLGTTKCTESVVNVEPYY